MKQINYGSLPHNNKRSSYTAPLAALVCGILTLAVMLIGPLFFPELLLQLDSLITLGGLVLCVIFIILLYRYFYETQITRNKLLRSFAKDNDFSFYNYRPSASSDYIPEFTSNSSLLSPGYRLTPRSNMRLEGTYGGVAFSVTVVGMYWSRPGRRAGVSFFAVITIHSEKLHTLPHIAALSKSTSRLFNSLNTELMNDSAWQRYVIGWEANAHYDIYARVDDTSLACNEDSLSKMMAEIYAISGSDVEISGNELYVIDVDGIDYTQEGLRSVFDKIAVTAKYL